LEQTKGWSQIGCSNVGLETRRRVRALNLIFHWIDDSGLGINTESWNRQDDPYTKRFHTREIQKKFPIEEFGFGLDQSYEQGWKSRVEATKRKAQVLWLMLQYRILSWFLYEDWKVTIPYS
jgi:hypothetical protein